MKSLAAFALVLASGPVAAEVVSASANGFEVRYTTELPVPPDAALRAFEDVGAWWNPDHTYSGSSANLTLQASPGGCFCERFAPGGGIEHMRVAYVDPGKRLVLTGSLGPLLYEATAGVMDVQAKPAAAGSLVTVNYRAAGFFKGGADKIAPLVDQVLAEQLRRFRAFATSRPRTN